MALFTLENFKISATFGVDRQSIRTFHPVLDSGATWNLIRKDALRNNWFPWVKMIRGPSIRDANRRNFVINAAIRLTVQTGDLSVEVEFFVCDNLSVPSVLGCGFITPHVDAIRRRKRRIFFISQGQHKGDTAIIKNLTLNGS